MARTEWSNILEEMQKTGHKKRQSLTLFFSTICIDTMHATFFSSVFTLSAKLTIESQEEERIHHSKVHKDYYRLQLCGGFKLWLFSVIILSLFGNSLNHQLLCLLSLDQHMHASSCTAQ